jgi:hypothetical protein
MRLEREKYSPFCICQEARWDTSRRTTYIINPADIRINKHQRSEYGVWLYGRKNLKVGRWRAVRTNVYLSYNLAPDLKSGPPCPRMWSGWITETLANPPKGTEL